MLVEFELKKIASLICDTTLAHWSRCSRVGLEAIREIAANRLVCVNLLLVSLSACGVPSTQKAALKPTEGKQGTPPSVSCDVGNEYAFDAMTPIGKSARELVEQYGRVRTASYFGDSRSLSPYVVSRDPRPELSIRFERGPGAIVYSRPCARLSVPVVLSVSLPDGARSKSTASMFVVNGSPSIIQLRQTPSDAAPFFLNARLVEADSDINIEFSDGSVPARFTTLCDDSTSALVMRDFGGTPPSLVDSPKLLHYVCRLGGNGTNAMAALLLSEMTLSSFSEDVCRVAPGFPKQSQIAIKIPDDWSLASLSGSIAFSHDGSIPKMHYRVSGSVRFQQELRQLVPCANDDERVTLQIEGGVIGGASLKKEQPTLKFSFSCEDVTVLCMANES